MTKNKMIFNDYSDDVKEAVRGGNIDAVDVITDMLTRKTRENCPVDSGDLFNSIDRSNVEEIGSKVKARVVAGDDRTKAYVRIIEFKQHPFFRKAGTSIKLIFKKIAREKQIDAVLKGGKRRRKPK